MNFFKKIESVLKNRIIQHILFWIFSFHILGLFFSQDYDTLYSKINLIYTFLFHWSIWFVVYPNLLIYIPRFLAKGKYIKYTFWLVFTLYIAAFLNHFTFQNWADKVFSDYYFISYYDFGDIFRFLIIYLVLTTLLKFSKSWFQQIDNQRLINNLQKEKLDAELKALKSQINPHFLFNSLNNLYGLALEVDKKTPEVILKLSKSMRYMLYESNDDFVNLDKEIEFLNHYLDLQKLRINEEARINFEISGKTKSKKIAPLLLIPFVENAFKHGIKGAVENAFIEIKLEISEKDLVFKVENNKGEIDEIEGSKYRGIGLKNVEKRLSLLYPQGHELTILNENEIFSILLKIKSI